MSSVRLDRRLLLEEAARQPDGAGGYVTTWSPKGTLWGAIQSGTGRERAGDAATLTSVAYRVTVRAAAEGAPSRPVAGQRLRDGARSLRIASVAESPHGPRFLTCIAIEEAAT